MIAPDDSAAILERLDALPTPSGLALRLLALSSDDASDARQLVEVIRQDAALSARILSLCRRGPRGRILDVASLDRAVVLLGFGAVRSAALAVEFVGSFGHAASTTGGFDPQRFWRHALAKAIVAETLSRSVVGAPSGGRSFTVALLQDLGALALARACPALFDRACDSSEERSMMLDDACVAVIGLSATAAGARLAERWSLPPELAESMRLRGPLALGADGSFRIVTQLAELADRIVRRRHLGGAGFGPRDDEPQPIARALGIDPSKIAQACEGLFEEVAARAEALGLGSPTPAALVADAIDRANRRLESLRDASQRAERTLEPMDDLDAATDVASTLASVVRQVRRLSGGEDRLLVVSSAIDGARAELREFGADGALMASRLAGEGDPEGTLAARRWCELRAPNGAPGRLLLALRGAVLATVYRAEGDVLATASLAAAPVTVWAFAIGAAMERERFRRQAERSAEAARTVEALRGRIARDRVHASIGELAGGLAHELNNPLCVVSGRAQLLAAQASDATRLGLNEIVRAAERASAVVSDLLRVARPAPVRPSHTDASEIIATAIRLLPPGAESNRIEVRMRGAQAAPPACFVDPAQVADALAEALQNALCAAPERRVEVSAEITAGDGRCMITVRDAGPGFSERALAHALDPFFSERPSGRGAGLGLAKARVLVEGSGGAIRLSNGEAGGAIVTISLPADIQGRTDERDEGRDARAGRREAA